MRFRPEQRLRHQNDIRMVRERGFRSDWRLFTVWCHRPDSTPARGPRVAVIASIAAVGAAVERNRAKRRLREVFRRHQQRVPPGCDLLLIARTAIKQAPFAELEQRFLSACDHLQRQAT